MRVALHAIAAASALVAGCASLDAPTAPPPAAAPTAAPTTAAAAATPPAARPAGAVPAAGPTVAQVGAPGVPPAAPPAAGQPQPFATVIKDAERLDGLLPVWRKDEKVWLELAPSDFGRPFFLSPKIAQGIGEAGLFGGTMIGTWGSFGRAQLVSFRRVHNQVQLVAENTRVRAADGTPTGRAVASGFSNSLVGSAAVASQPHPDRKTVLVELNPMLLADVLGLGIQLQRQYKQTYGFDRGNSAITSVRTKPDELMFAVQAHYAAATLATAQTGQPLPPGTTPPSQPRMLPDARSLFFGLHYSLVALPAQPMAPRPADARVGYFTTNIDDFSDDLARTPTQRYVNRWRLEKKDPTAALSEPVKPITYWLDRTIPVKYREAIMRGVLAWNAAFEKIGFKNAVVAKVQPDDADFDTLDVHAASIRWMTNSSPQFGAIGPSQVDPRSGEILDADIGFESLSSRNQRFARTQFLAHPGEGTEAEWSRLMQLPVPGATHRHDGDEACMHATHAAEQLGYALDVLDARGDIAPDGPEAEQWVLEYLSDTTMHEVGHTLGLRHNFRSSRIYTLAQMNDPAFVRANGLAGSVMEYAPINLAAPGSPRVPGFQLNLGPYDYWAIEYGYKPMPPGTTPQQERDALLAIAARSAEPALAYGTDEDNFLGIDPDAVHFDLGDDPVAFARQRIAIARDLIERQSTRTLAPSADYAVLRRSIGYALRELGRNGGILARQIGGLRTLRDHPGSGRDPLQPVEAARQRLALDTLAKHYLAADAVRVPPALQRRLAPNFDERGETLRFGEQSGNASTDFSPASAVLDMQRALLTQLLSDDVAQRILDAVGKADDPAQAFRLSELYERMTRDIWSELDAKSGDVPGMRRALQREHAQRLAATILRPAAQGRADQRSLQRAQARALLARIEGAQRRAGLSDEAKAHLDDSAELLRQALQARVARPV